ncbi:MAG: tRNA (N6-isopentenyl adenosine(37)-C2)-methylthiotransferase MiaB [candidate division WOR-3 bacterium]|nr:tRNA (N6-isopentenyl adenosine(37)-C2)-methylthiotransferase MiaB [candidate division WOR-3 bacterium]MCX7948217.1 tRNA (N6-isopentenyl adenosine(37)-C2)-methylthiotransferase MiaB [candidate division WOR-3 bacterium]MDW8150019.1 tRNA (N6-isopentenyl adenosine(37)-C2)-methylthiotransferase MiaB [candidate division WOR-3 bacterium]
MKTFYIKTFGCQMNEHDSELIRQKLINQGYIETNSEKHAEIILINTCSVRKKAEEKAIQYSRQMKNKNKTVVMLGCLAQHKGQELLSISKADIVIGTRSYEKIIDILLDFEKKGTKRAICEDLGIFQLKRRKVREGEFSSYVNIQQGCDNFCTFCVVPYTRGRETSRNAYDILEEVIELEEQGIIEITLLGQNVDSYFDGKYDFSDLLKLLEDNTKYIKRIKFTSPNPRDMTMKVIKTISNSEKLVRWIHLPLQAGSNKILRKMNRGYTKEEYIYQALTIRDLIKDVSITTDIIVGFPYETEEDFYETLDVVKNVKYDGAYMFKYSKREGTPASLFKEQVDEETKGRRLRELIENVNNYIMERRKLMLNREYEVLIEGESKKDIGYSVGKTFNNISVVVKGFFKPGTIVKGIVKEIRGHTPVLNIA